jgi:stearoyl-CoA desaturase (Delta-9 desaturase)
MTRLERNINLIAVFGPFVALAAIAPLAWHTDLLNWSDIAVFALMYVVSGFGITVGYHRLLTHRAFQTHRWVEYAFAVVGGLAVQGRVIDWVADHRKHHAHTDEDGDPHSPHAGQGAGVRGALRGLYHAHVGWLFSEQGRARPDKYARDLFEDPGMRLIHRSFLWIVLATFAIPFALGFALTQSLHGALTALLWGGLVRVSMLHHITWSINSVCHFFGRRRFATDDHSTNVFWLALPSLGESWHHNHHAFPRSAFHGLRPWEVDVSALVVRGLRRLGLAWNVVEITPERQSQLQA